jgi:type I restriction enzyme S subunit
MSYAPYPDSEESGVVWIGRKPRHWQVMKLHHMVRMRSGSGITSVEMEDDGEYPVFGGNGVRGNFPQYTHDGSYVLIGRQGAECGNINYAHGKFWASEHAVVATPDRDLEYRWLGETLRAMNLNQYSQAAAQPGLSVEVIGRLKLPFPPLPEQQQIAAFLDWKTGQIDALIARKQELLEKLKEKRLAVITQAVTRGLNAAVPLRDSGIAWLGNVPKHWEVKRLRFATSRIEQGWSPQCENQPADEGFWGVMKVGCVNGDTFDVNENKALPPELEPPAEYELRAGDILISRANTRELLGSAAIVPEGTRSKLLLCDKLYRVSPEPGLRNDFLTFFLRTPAARFQYEREATGASSSMQNIAQPTIKNLPAVIPPLEEQQAICDHIRLNVAKLDTLLGAVEAAVARLTEYRTALITAATTGKIDVRGVKIPNLAT